MATRVENLSSGKVIGFGTVNILPGETRTIPVEYENSPALKFYEDNGFARITRNTKVSATAVKVRTPEPSAETENKAASTEGESVPAEGAEESRKEKKTKSAAKS